MWIRCKYLKAFKDSYGGGNSSSVNIPKRTLGKTGAEVTILGLGGEGVLRTIGYEQEAYGLINRAIDLGINYFESARAYSGSESYYGLALKERRKDIFLTSKSHARDKPGAFAHLHETLTNMKTDHLDLWQVHDVRTDEDIEEIFGPRGALEAFREAKDKGLVRFIGVTGHHDPLITKRCIEMFDFDTVLIPVNPAEPSYKSYIDTVIPPASQKGIGIIAMKVYFRGFAARIPAYQGMEPFFRFALSQPVTTAVIGCDDIHQLEENVSFASSFTPMLQEEQNVLLEFVAPYARQLMYYKP
jgi:predicted aldo/keto reductase-like oxidoreductase